MSHSVLTAAWRVAAVRHAGGEVLELGVQFGLLLLAHRPAEQVGGAQRVAGDVLRDRHHLLLVDDQTVGVAQDLGQRLGQLGVDRHDRLAAVLAVGVLVVRVGAHRARAGTARRPRRCPRSCPAASTAAARASGRRRAGTPRGCRRGPAARRSSGRPAARSSRTTVSPRLALMLTSASSRTVRLRSPRKSILINPSFSQVG